MMSWDCTKNMVKNPTSLVVQRWRAAPYSETWLIISCPSPPFLGPVVRVAPNELSFNSAQAWKDIYGHRKGHATFIKSHFYDRGNFANQAHSIVSERDPVKHSKMRKYLSSAFSDRSLKEQEHLVIEKVDEFIDQIYKSGSTPAGIDMTLWFNLLTFDVIGELAFGQSFDGLKSGMIIWEDGQKFCAALNNRILLTGATHFWVSIVLESMGQASFSDTLSRFPFLGRLYMRFNPEWLKKLIEGSARHEKYTLDLIHKLVFSLWKKKEENTSLTEPKKNQAENRPERLYKLSLKSRTREHRGGNCNHSTGSPRIRLRVRLFKFWFYVGFCWRRRQYCR